jgi:hypothetical protein
MMYHDDDELDRALFALPLEEPPGDLRAAILTATAYRPAPPFSVWEFAFFGVVAAVMVWMVIEIALGGGPLFASTVTAIGTSIVHGLPNVTTLAWLTAGGATAFWLTFFTGSQPFALAAQRFGRRTSR